MNECPECGKRHTDEPHPTIGQVLGPCVDQAWPKDWWKADG